MIIDGSAIIAVLRDEVDAPSFTAALVRKGEPKKMSVASWLEAAIVIDGSRDPVASSRLDSLCRDADIELVELSVEQARIARQAYQNYGRGSGHPARLNFGDCFAYALARESGEPLLFKGADFSLTDIFSAI